MLLAATMKKNVVFMLLLMLSVQVFAQKTNKGFIDKDTKLFSLVANIRQDHLIIGYAQPDITTQKLICISVFTSDVEHNKYKCPLGAYYQTSDLPEGDNIYFMNVIGQFAKMRYVNSVKKETIFYIKKSWIDFSI